MSLKVKSDYLRSIDELKRKIWKASIKLENLALEKSVAEEAVRDLKLKKSSLAKNLLEKKCEKLKGIQSEFAKVQQEQLQYEDELKRIYRLIDKVKHKDSTLYIEIIEMMVNEFWSYVGNYIDEKSCGGKIEFVIFWGRINMYEGKDWVTDKPEGYLEIVNLDNQYDVVTVKYFYLDESKMYDKIRSESGYKCEITQWYKDYEKKVMGELIKALIEACPYGDDLKLTFENPSFIVELQ